MVIFGNVENFGIQVENPELNLSEVCLWLNGMEIGSYREQEYLKFIYNQLNRVLSSKFNKLEDINFENLSIDYLIKNEDSFLSQNILSLGSSFDDFLIRVVLNDEFIYVFWKIVKNPFYSYERYKISSKNYKAQILKSNYLSVLSELKLIVD